MDRVKADGLHADPRRPSAPGADFSRSVSRSDWGGGATRAEIDLDALTVNVQALRSHVKPAQVIAVVKANAYGHGAVQVASAAIEAGASMVATYATQEAAALRKAGIDAPILMFGQFERTEAALVAPLNVTATVWDRASVDLLDSVSDRRVDVHLKIDTGLHRAGVGSEDAVALARHIASCKHVHLAGAFTHFACADEPNSHETERQLRRFLGAVNAITEAGIPVPLTHAANSGAALDHRNTHLDAVRCGISLYGYAPNPLLPKSVPLKPVMSLLSKITRIHRLRAGEGVGYGHQFHAKRTSLIALVPIGYGDGLLRSLGNGRGKVLIAGQASPIVGRVSMDQITVDVTDIAGAEVGSEVVIVGRSENAIQDAHALGHQAGTICYEVLSAVAARVPRVYVRNGRVLGER